MFEREVHKASSRETIFCVTRTHSVRISCVGVLFLCNFQICAASKFLSFQIGPTNCGKPVLPVLSLYQLLYLVVWCAVFSTLRLYITAGDYWVLCLCVSLIAIFITTAIIFVLNLSNNKVNRVNGCLVVSGFSSVNISTNLNDSETCLILCQINMNLDVRLIRVNEYMVKHKLLVAVADWVQNCNGNMQVDPLESTLSSLC